MLSSSIANEPGDVPPARILCFGPLVLSRVYLLATLVEFSLGMGVLFAILVKSSLGRGMFFGKFGQRTVKIR